MTIYLSKSNFIGLCGFETLIPENLYTRFWSWKKFKIGSTEWLELLYLSPFPSLTCTWIFWKCTCINWEDIVTLEYRRVLFVTRLESLFCAQLSMEENKVNTTFHLCGPMTQTPKMEEPLWTPSSVERNV